LQFDKLGPAHEGRTTPLPRGATSGCHVQAEQLQNALVPGAAIDGTGESEIAALWITTSEDKELLRTLFGKKLNYTC